MNGLFFPEWYIWTNRDTIMCGLPGFIPYLCLGNLFVGIIVFASFVIGLTANSTLAVGAVIWYITVKLGSELLVGSAAWIYSATIWKILPWFICDILFYFFVYIAPVLNFLYHFFKNLGKSKRE